MSYIPYGVYVLILQSPFPNSLYLLSIAYGLALYYQNLTQPSASPQCTQISSVLSYPTSPSSLSRWLSASIQLSLPLPPSFSPPLTDLVLTVFADAPVLPSSKSGLFLWVVALL